MTKKFALGGLLVCFLLFNVAFGLGFAGGWIAPYARTLEIAGVVSFFGMGLFTLLTIITHSRKAEK